MARKPAAPTRPGKQARTSRAAQTIAFDKVDFKGRTFELKSPLRAKIAFDGDVWTLESKAIAIRAYGTTEREARAAFEMEFAASWDMLAGESDDNLTIDARGLKKRLLDCVARVSA